MHICRCNRVKKSFVPNILIILSIHTIYCFNVQYLVKDSIDISTNFQNCFVLKISRLFQNLNLVQQKHNLKLLR